MHGLRVSFNAFNDMEIAVVSQQFQRVFLLFKFSRRIVSRKCFPLFSELGKRQMV